MRKMAQIPKLLKSPLICLIIAQCCSAQSWPFAWGGLQQTYQRTQQKPSTYSLGQQPSGLQHARYPQYQQGGQQYYANRQTHSAVPQTQGWSNRAAQWPQSPYAQSQNPTWPSSGNIWSRNQYGGAGYGWNKGGKSQRLSQCCAAKRVPANCLKLCSFQSWQSYTHLFPYCPLNDILTCASNSRDHTACCRSAGVQPICLQFCTGRSVSNWNDSRLRVCYQDAYKIAHCLQS